MSTMVGDTDLVPVWSTYRKWLPGNQVVMWPMTSC